MEIKNVYQEKYDYFVNANIYNTDDILKVGYFFKKIFT